jgi:hypothetical protein
MTGCQWVGPEQDPQRAPLEFCGCLPLWPGRSYCEEHVWRVYQKGSALGQSRKNKAIEKELSELKRLEEIANDENEV